jgi:hypothetical protein
MKTKISAFAVMSLLLVGMFAISFGMAQDVDDLLEDEASFEEDMGAEEIQDELEKTYGGQRDVVGLSKMTKAFGWISQDGKAHAFDAIWVSLKVPTISNETESEEPMRKRSFGKLKVGNRVFKLVKKEFTEDSLSFYVLPKTTELSKDNLEDLDSLAIGVLEVSPGNTTPLQTWSGTLEITNDSEEHEGTWDVSAASHTRVKKGVVKEGFWKRLAFWKRGNSEGSKNDDLDSEGQEKRRNNTKLIRNKVQRLKATEI